MKIHRNLVVCCAAVSSFHAAQIMRRLQHICAGFLLLPLSATAATTITLEPDSYALGTDLSTISPYVTVSTTGGNPVYASTIDKTGTSAAGGANTGPLGDAVFSRTADSNSEWFYWPELGDDQNGLAFTFSQPVTSFSLLFAELFQDAGCCTDDPTRIFIYAPDNSLIETVDADFFPPTGYLGIDPNDQITPIWPYWQFAYSGNIIGKIIIGGYSEPTSVDRLVFTVVPLPAAVWFFATGLIGLAGLAGRRTGQSANGQPVTTAC
jgi:hypothetical protein